MKPFAIACKANELLALLHDKDTVERRWLFSARCPQCWSRDHSYDPEPGYPFDHTCCQCNTEF